MPSKPVGILILLLIAGGIAGMTQLDLRRDVPWLPADMAAATAGLPAPRVPPVPGGGEYVGPPGETPPRETPREGPAVPPPPGGGETGEQIRVTDLELPMIASMATVPFSLGEEDDAAILKIYADGKLRWAGLEAGSYEMLASLCEQAALTPNFHVLIVPDANVHWQWVYQAMETAREAGIVNVGIGVASSADRTGKVLAEYPVRLPRKAYVEDPDMPQLPIVIKWDENGELLYEVFGDPVENNTEGRYIQDLYERIAAVHSDYGGMFEEAYYEAISDPATNPWVLIPRPDIPAGTVLRAAEAVRQCAIKTLRFSDELPD